MNTALPGRAAIRALGTEAVRAVHLDRQAQAFLEAQEGIVATRSGILSFRKRAGADASSLRSSSISRAGATVALEVLHLPTLLARAGWIPWQGPCGARPAPGSATRARAARHSIAAISAFRPASPARAPSAERDFAQFAIMSAWARDT